MSQARSWTKGAGLSVGACALFFAALSCGAVSGAAATLELKCWAPSAVFLDGFVFPALRTTVVIDPAEGWSSDYEQFAKRTPEGITILIARDSGRLEKYDRASHIQLGRCRTVKLVF